MRVALPGAMGQTPGLGLVTLEHLHTVLSGRDWHQQSKLKKKIKKKKSSISPYQELSHENTSWVRPEKFQDLGSMSVPMYPHRYTYRYI